MNIANEVFGYNGWYTEVKELAVDFVRPSLPLLALILTSCHVLSATW